MTPEEITAEVSAPIDLTDLENILSRHTYLLQAATERVPELKHQVNAAKAGVERTYAELFLKVKAEAVKEKLKITDKATDAMVLGDARYRKAQDNLFALKRDLDEVERIANLFHSRESALRRLVDLFQAQYWSLHGVVTEQAQKKKTGGFKT